MPVPEALVETTEYRLLLVLPETLKVLAIRDVDGYHLPSISVTQWTRHAEQLQKAIRAAWNLHVVTLELLQGLPPCAVAEVLVPGKLSGLDAVSPEHLHRSELIELRTASSTHMSPRPFDRSNLVFDELTRNCLSNQSHCPFHPQIIPPHNFAHSRE